MVGWNSAIRKGEWLELDFPADAGAGAASHDPVREAPLPPIQPYPLMPEAGSHPHAVRNWLLACAFFPAKWINRLFSVGGIRWMDGRIQLHAFPKPPLVGTLYGGGRSAESDSGSTASRTEEVGRRQAYALYEDDYCLVMFKPAGLRIHASFPGERGTLDEAAAEWLAARGDPLTVRHIHRLDDATSGPVLYAKNDLAQLVLDEAMREKRIGRRYIAVVHGQLRQASGVVDAPIGKDRRHGSRRRVAPSGEAAITRFERLGFGAGMSLLSLELETGRTHQIRVHMSHIGHPLVGDALYGGSVDLLGHQALHGERLLFPHPLTGLPIEAHAPWPDWLQKLSRRIRPS